MSFQNIEGAQRRVLDLFGLDIASPLLPEEWARVQLSFKKRHLIAHKLGVIDDQYVRTSGDPDAIAGRKLRLAQAEVEALTGLLERVGQYLTRELGL